MTMPRSPALSRSISSNAARTPWCTRVEPPTVPTAMGISSSPRTPVSVRRHTASGRYCPSREANECAPASRLRQSCPVANATESQPFMMPLLWVTARNGSSSAKRLAFTIPSATFTPPSASAITSQDTFTVRRSGRLLRMRRPIWPPISACSSGATASATVSTTLAPIASPTST